MSDNSSDGNDKLLKFPDLEIYESEYNALRKIEDLVNGDRNWKGVKLTYKTRQFKIEESFESYQPYFGISVENGHLVGLAVSYVYKEDLAEEICGIINDTFPMLRDLKHVDVKKLVFRKSMPTVERLIIESYHHEDFPDLTAFPNLKAIALKGWSNLPDDFIARLSGLHRLESIYIKNTMLSKKTVISEEIGELINLKEIEIRDYHLKTPLPDSMANLVNLERFIVYDANWAEFPKVLLGLSKLKELVIEYHYLPDFIEITEGIGQLRNLERLELLRSNITKLPDTLFTLKNLKKIVLRENKLTSFPEGLTKMTQMEHIKISGGDLKSIPSDIGNLKNLDYLDLRGNQISELPKSVCRLEKLTYLYCKDNLLEKIPLCLLDLPNISTIDVDSNKFSKSYIEQVKALYNKKRKEENKWFDVWIS